ncbi:hypothetical protein MRX96_002283 [Rhipicephalus microplus]
MTTQVTVNGRYADQEELESSDWVTKVSIRVAELQESQQRERDRATRAASTSSGCGKEGRTMPAGFNGDKHGVSGRPSYKVSGKKLAERSVASHLPRLPNADHKVIIRPKEGLTLTRNSAPVIGGAYGLYPVWDQNFIVINTPNEALIRRLLNIWALKFPDRTVPVHSYLKPTNKMGRGVIRLANHISTDYIVQRAVSLGNKVIQARRLGTTNIVVLTFEHEDVAKYVLAFLEKLTLYNATARPSKPALLVTRSVTVSSQCPTCGKADVDLSNPECLTCCVLCNGPHITGARECP